MSDFGSTMKTLTIPDDDPVRIYRSAVRGRPFSALRFRL